MSTTTMSSRAFNQDSSGAEKAAGSGPLFITDRGRPACGLLTIDEYHRLTETSVSIVDLLAMPGAEDIELEPARLAACFLPVDLG